MGLKFLFSVGWVWLGRGSKMANLRKMQVVYVAYITCIEYYQANSFFSLEHYSYNRITVVRYIWVFRYIWYFNIFDSLRGGLGWILGPQVHLAVGWVKSGQLFGGLGRAGSTKIDPQTTLLCTASVISDPQRWGEKRPAEKYCRRTPEIPRRHDERRQGWHS